MKIFTLKSLLGSALLLVAMLFSMPTQAQDCTANLGTVTYPAGTNTTTTPPTLSTNLVALDANANLLLNNYDGFTGATDLLWVVVDADSLYDDANNALDGPIIVGFSEDGTFDFSTLGPGNYCYEALVYNQTEVTAILGAVGGILSCPNYIAQNGALTSLPDIYYCLVESGLYPASGVSFDQQLIQGYETDGNCIGEPIPTPKTQTEEKKSA